MSKLGKTYPIIVIEGPDGAGKTTLADRLVKTLGAKYLHLTYRWGPRMFDYHTAALYYVLRQAKKQPVILDRWWLSEIVYANVYRGGSKWPLAYRLFEMAALRHSFIYVMCRPGNRHNYIEHFQKLKSQREEMYSDNMEKVYDGYGELMQMKSMRTRTNIIKYDWMVQGDKLDDVVSNIIEAAFDAKVDCPVIDNMPYEFFNLGGHPAFAKALLVGDELKPKTRREVWPFFEYGNSSLWLHQTLHDLNVPAYQVMTMNAKHRYQNITDSYFRIFKNYNIPIVAMGNNAYEHLVGLGIRVDHKINHPQHYRRFDVNAGVLALEEVFKK